MEKNEALKVVSDINSDPISLAKVAYENAEMHEKIISHPNVYEGLLAWMTVFSNDNMVKKLAYERLDQISKSNQNPVTNFNLSANVNANNANKNNESKNNESIVKTDNKATDINSFNTQTPDVKPVVTTQSSQQPVVQPASPAVVASNPITTQAPNTAVQNNDDEALEINTTVPISDLQKSIAEMQKRLEEDKLKTEEVEKKPESSSTGNSLVDDMLSKYQSKSPETPSTTPNESHNDLNIPGVRTIDSFVEETPKEANPWDLPAKVHDYANYYNNQQGQSRDVNLPQSQTPEQSPVQPAVKEQSPIDSTPIWAPDPAPNHTTGFETTPTATTSAVETPTYQQSVNSAPTRQESATHGFTIAQALDPSIDPNTLADIAEQAPELREYVAFNPKAYPELLQWLADLDDPVLNKILLSKGYTKKSF